MSKYYQHGLIDNFTLDFIICRCFSQSHYGFSFRPEDCSLLYAIPVSHLSPVCLSFTLPSLFPFLPPPTTSLFFCLQPCRRPSLQPSLDCLFAPSPHHLCHPNQQFTSQFSLCLGNSHSSSDCTFSHKPSPSLCSSSLPHQSFSCPDLKPRSTPFETTSNGSHSSSQYNTSSKVESKAQPNLPSPPHTSSDSQSNSSCFHKMNALTKSHFLCSSQSKSNSSRSHHCRFTVHSQTSPNPNTLHWRMSNVCPQTLQDIQHRSNACVKTLLLPRFHIGFQTNPLTPLQSESDPQNQHPAMLSCDRLGLSSASSLPPPERLFAAPSTCTLSYTDSACSSLESLTIPPHPHHLPCFEGPMTKSLKAGALHLKQYILNQKVATLI